jgi:Circadian oscillating protein COP23
MKLSKIFQIGAVSLFVFQSPVLFATSSLAKQPNNNTGFILAGKPAPTVARPKPNVAAPNTSPNVSTATPPKKKVVKKTKLDKIIAKKVRYNFSCINGNTTALIAKTTKKQLSPTPIIVWTEEGSKQFGSQYSPSARCSEVTARFNQHFLKTSSTKGSFIRLPAIRIGQLNRQPVVCASNSDCTSSNLLWTLKKDNAKQGSTIIAQLKDLVKSKGKATVGPILESDDDVASLESEDEVAMEDVVASSISAKLESEEPEIFAELESEDAEESAQLESEDAPELESAEMPELESAEVSENISTEETP